MKTFKQYLEDRQMMMFSTKPVELYHGTNTGPNNETLQSFTQKGAMPNVAQGYGQGAGFYVWSDRKSAASHTEGISKDSITTRAKVGGNPMIVTVEAIADPEKWDLDYEQNKKPIVNWLYDNFEKIQPLIDSDEINLRSKRMANVLDPKDRLVSSKTLAVTFGGTYAGLSADVDSNIRSGEILAAIMNRLQQKDPHTVHKFEELLFANMRPGFTLKYVGHEPLQIKRIEVFKDAQWKSEM